MADDQSEYEQEESATDIDEENLNLEEKMKNMIIAAEKATCYGPPALYTLPTPYAFPGSTYLMPLNPLPYLVHVPLFKSPRLTLIT